MENYVTIEADSKKDINIKFDTTDDKTYFYGMSNGKKILYNIKEDKIMLLKRSSNGSTKSSWNIWTIRNKNLCW